MNLKIFQRPTCHDSGLKLRIGSSINFPNFILTAKWLTAKVTITELHFNFNNFNSVQVDAFATEAFSTVRNLTLQFVAPRRMEVGTLNGLHSLRSLDFVSSQVQVFESGLLNNLAGTLEKLTLNEWISSSPPLLVDGLTGGAHMTALKRVTFYYNMDKTVTERTFVGLMSVTHLDLQGCRMVAIGENSFNPISNTIQELNLSENRLTTLAAGLFDLIIPRPGVRIIIDNNLWLCDCQLCYFKWVLLNSEVVVQFDPAECRTPISLRFSHVESTDFCFGSTDCESYELIPSINPPITPNPTTVLTTATTLEQNSEEETPTISTTTISTTTMSATTIEEEVQLRVPQICSTFTAGEPVTETINLNARVNPLKIFDINIGEVLVGAEGIEINSALLWYDRDGYNCAHELNSTPECGSTQCRLSFYIRNDEFPTIHIKNLKTNHAYIFCIVGDVGNAALSPLDCIPHFVAAEPTKPPDETVWLKTDHRELLIGMVVLGITVSVLLGMVLGYVVLQRNPGWLRGSKHVTMVSSITEISNQKSERISSVR